MEDHRLSLKRADRVSNAENNLKTLGQMFLKTLFKPERVVFIGSHQIFTSATRLESNLEEIAAVVDEKVGATTQSLDSHAITSEAIAAQFGSSPASEQERTSAGELRYRVWMVIKELLDKRLDEQLQLPLPAVGLILGKRFPEVKPIHNNLGFATLTDLILSFDNFTITGEHPQWVVQYREDRLTPCREDLRHQVWIVIRDLIDRNIFQQQPLYLPTVGFTLAERFPEVKPLHKNLGFATLTDLILSFDNFTITGKHPQWVVQYCDQTEDLFPTPQ